MVCAMALPSNIPAYDFEWKNHDNEANQDMAVVIPLKNIYITLGMTPPCWVTQFCGLPTVL
jgi:hypothetical protein